MMVARNMLNSVVETVEYTDGILTRKNRTNYKAFVNSSNTIIAPAFLQAANYNNALETKFTFTRYDALGNMLEQQKEKDTKEVFLWGYNSQYPVAKILNTTLDIARTYITQTVLDLPANDATLRNHLNNLRSMPGAFVTTYTYKPLIGITSETDVRGRTTFYEYDSFNRLSLIRDQDQNILKKICYNYAGQPANCN
jgi:YD repeat-containing protein